jgi:hypothetical protein
MKEEKTLKLRCVHCGKRFKKGGVKYNILIEVASDFDGYVEDWSKKPLDYLEKQMAKLEKEFEQKDEKEIEEEVYLRRKSLFCPKCREKFLQMWGKFVLGESG